MKGSLLLIGISFTSIALYGCKNSNKGSHATEQKSENNKKFLSTSFGNTITGDAPENYFLEGSSTCIDKTAENFMANATDGIPYYENKVCHIKFSKISYGTSPNKTVLKATSPDKELTLILNTDGTVAATDKNGNYTKTVNGIAEETIDLNGERNNVTGELFLYLLKPGVKLQDALYPIQATPSESIIDKPTSIKRRLKFTSLFTIKDLTNTAGNIPAPVFNYRPYIEQEKNPGELTMNTLFITHKTANQAFPQGFCGIIEAKLVDAKLTNKQNYDKSPINCPEFGFKNNWKEFANKEQIIFIRENDKYFKIIVRKQTTPEEDKYLEAKELATIAANTVPKAYNELTNKELTKLPIEVTDASKYNEYNLRNEFIHLSTAEKELLDIGSKTVEDYIFANKPKAILLKETADNLKTALNPDPF